MDILPFSSPITTPPIQLVEDPVLSKHKVQLWIKREDLLHPHISGNKWRKLKYNLQAARQQGQKVLLTFGGAFSNHIAAVAAAGKTFGFRTIGIIRGEEHLPLNATLAFAQEQGMELRYMSRSTYKEKEQPEVMLQLREQFGKFYLIPEGGSNALAVQGCAEIIHDLETSAYDYICTACGTGATLAGLVAGMNRKKQLLGFPVLKGGSFLKAEVDRLTKEYNGQLYHNYQLMTDYHFGGYAKWKPELLNFMNIFREVTGIPLDPIYTGKMLFGLYNLVQKGFFKPGTSLLAIHTGGLQGVKGFRERFGDLI
ncbi:1-aminocyclopropane-1-carboxylate deaminase/D-cysteine desulfhydrase [Nafulsella turpanensis]|uniref:1-aminocyclopropane-1-carboxylate deaminase/D-cysteine desulfhydrase n=1 Tax=Nafulsella turpanensis TaxID=1265690 RepID=UPI000346D85D